MVLVPAQLQAPILKEDAMIKARYKTLNFIFCGYPLGFRLHFIHCYFRQRRHLIVHCPYSIGVLSIAALATSSVGSLLILIGIHSSKSTYERSYKMPIILTMY